MRPALPLLLWLLVAGPAAAERVDGVAAVVGDEVILISELERASGPLIKRIARERGTLAPDQVKQLRKEALESLINDRLIAAIAKRANVVATEEEIDTAIAGIAQEEGVTPEQIYQAAAEQGLPRQLYRKELGSQITRMKVISGSVRSRVTVSETEIAELYLQRYASLEPGTYIRTRHILLPWPKAPTPETRAELLKFAHELRERALEAGDFANLARRYSMLRSAAQGGFTVLRESELSPEIAAQVLPLEPGAISEPIQTDHGVNLFQMINSFDPSKVELEEVRDVLYAELLERKTAPEFERWIESQREQRYIGIVLPELQ